MTGPFLLDAALLGELAEAGAALDVAVEKLLASGRLRVLQVPHWAERVDDAEGRHRAFGELFEACRKPVDGVVSRHLNRHISLGLSKRLVSTRITPNMVSSVTLFIGLLAALSVARGGYGPVLVGAALWQLNSILDGVDGELARVRFEHSRLGQWLDTLSDDLSNVAFWAALGIGSANLEYGEWLLVSGFTAAGANLGLALVYYAQLIAMGSGDVYDIIGAPTQTAARGLIGKAHVALRSVLKKDFFVFFCLVLAVFGVLPYASPLFAVFAVGAFLSAVSGFVRRRGGLRVPGPSSK